MIEKIKRGILIFLEKYLFPTGIYCIACGALIDESREFALCDTCMQSFHWANGITCEKCGKPLLAESSEIMEMQVLNNITPLDITRGVEDNKKHAKICNDCLETEHSFDKGYSCFYYGDLEKKPIIDLKYHRKGYVARKLALIMTERMRKAIKENDGEIFFDIVIPIPIYKTRKRQRGYNQSWLLAKYFAREIGVPASEDYLIRTRHTERMSGLDKHSRLENIKGAFEVRKIDEIKGKNILLLDDIYTTGSTADEAAHTLKEAGAHSVYLLTLAAGGS